MNKIYLTLCLILLFGSLQAQNLLGVANSNYAGTNGLYLNPSSIAGSKHRFFLNFFSWDVYISNNYFAAGQPFANLLETDKFKLSLLEEKKNGNFLGLGVDVRLPEFMVKLGAKSSMALGVRPRLLLTANNVSQNLYTLARFDGNFSDAYRNVPFTNASGNLNINAINEYKASYARVMYNEGKHFLKVGATLKYLVGYVSYNINAQNGNFFIDNNDFLNLQSADMSLGYNQSDPNNIFRGNRARGIGGDFGLTYEYRPNPTANQYQMDGTTLTNNQLNMYKYRVGLSVIDVGGLRYKNNDARSYKLSPRDVVLSDYDINEPDSLAANLGANLSIIDRNLKMTLPTMLIATFDYNIHKKIYANLTVGQKLKRINSAGMMQGSFVGITPRYESRLLEFALPISVTNNYKTFNLGASIRLGYLFVGSDNLLGTLVQKTSSGANVYMGLNLPIFNKKKPRDKDKDGVSNKKDACPDVAGVVALRGCPDADSDGITDKEDQCPNEAGLAKFQGCPDTDGDGIMDKEDKCPTVAGIAKFQGCPDTDGDGITDAEDKCPTVAGIAKFQGCPDTDGDGIMDQEDNCPTLAGLAKFQGCPDKDGDGVMDKEDKCPDVAGVVENAGCPKNKIEAEKLSAIAKEIQFETAKSVIKPISFATLDQLVALMQQYPLAKIVVEGHTDNVGNNAANKALSQKRANAIKKYLTKKGIDTTRMTSVGFGSEKPKDGLEVKAGNKTPQQRAANRRVEIKSID